MLPWGQGQAADQGLVGQRQDLEGFWGNPDPRKCGEMPTGLKGFQTNPSGKKLPKHPVKPQGDNRAGCVISGSRAEICPYGRGEKGLWGFWLLERCWGLHWAHPCLLEGDIVRSFILADVGVHRDLPSQRGGSERSLKVAAPQDIPEDGALVKAFLTQRAQAGRDSSILTKN